MAKKRSLLPGVRLAKTYNFGPLRVNLSGSGVGVSVGVPNLRAGAGPTGKYLSIFGRRIKIGG